MKFGIIILSIILLTGCYRITSTPKEYLTKSKIDKSTYLSDKKYFKDLFSYLLNDNIKPFNVASIYDKNSQLTVDTIFYSNDSVKMVVFLIIKNSMLKFDRFDTDTSKYLYTGLHFYCFRNDMREIIVNKNCRFIFEAKTNDDLKESFYSYAIKRKATDHPFNGQKQYNLNDVRLWTSKQMNFEMNDSIHLVKLVSNGLIYLKKSQYKSD